MTELPKLRRHNAALVVFVAIIARFKRSHTPPPLRVTDSLVEYLSKNVSQVVAEAIVRASLHISL